MRAVQAGEGELLRELRLRALRDAPRAFASPFEAEQARPPEYWQELAAASGEGRERVVLVVVSEERWIATAAARWFDQGAGIVQLWGMWVEPPARGRGIGRILIDAVAQWAGQRGGRILRLGVTEPAARVVTFYERLGFERTGETKLLPPEGAVKAFFLARAV